MIKDEILEGLKDLDVITEDMDVVHSTSSGENPVGGDTEATEAQYTRIVTLLDNDKINHAGVIKQLWGTKDATKRSLFRKKLNREANDSGGEYAFDTDEISKIMSILMNFSNEIEAAIKPKKTKSYSKAA